MRSKPLTSFFKSIKKEIKNSHSPVKSDKISPSKSPSQPYSAAPKVAQPLENVIKIEKVSVTNPEITENTLENDPSQSIPVDVQNMTTRELREKLRKQSRVLFSEYSKEIESNRKLEKYKNKIKKQYKQSKCMNDIRAEYLSIYRRIMKFEKVLVRTKIETVKEEFEGEKVNKRELKLEKKESNGKLANLLSVFI